MLKPMLLLFIALLASPCIAAESYDDKNLWLLKSYDLYKVKVYRTSGRAHAGDYVQVDIYERLANGDRKLSKIIDLPTPGYKGYIQDIIFNTVKKDRVAVTFHIQMKAMEGVILTELFVINNKGEYEKLVNATYADLFE